MYLWRLNGVLIKPDIIPFFFGVFDKKNGQFKLIFSKFKKGDIGLDQLVSIARVLRRAADDMESANDNPLENYKGIINVNEPPKS